VSGTAPAGGAPRLLIDGELRSTARTFPSHNPATGKQIGEAPDAGQAEAEAAIAAARRAFDTTDWSTNTTLRVRCLRDLHAALLDERESLRELTIAEVGAPRQLTHGPQLDAPVDTVGYYADLLEGYEFSEELGTSETRGLLHRRWVEKEAAGVVAAIIAYNFPNQLALAKIAPALAAGCTVVLKAAPQTPLITLALADLIKRRTSIPPGVVNVISSSGPESGTTLTTHPDVDMVTFTGSTATGRRIMAAAADTVKKVFLELGGKSAMIFLDDADLQQAAIFAAFTVTSHSGQGCALTSRLLVPRAQHDRIAAMVGAIMGKVRVGDPADATTNQGPLISEEQRDKVDAMVRRAVAEGATLVRGGNRIDPGYFYEPTLLSGVDPDSEIAQEEVFGPVLAVIPYDDDDDAVRIANNSSYGLSGAIMGADQERCLRIARRIRTGTFSVNGGNYFGSDAPFGGYKQSGIGRESGRAGLEEFLELKTLATVVGPAENQEGAR
jgi:acyl-CoA reductase-like NAD-dependent aldehyde dehydrogenase